MNIPASLQHIHRIDTNILTGKRKAGLFTRSEIHGNVMPCQSINMAANYAERPFRFHHDMTRFPRENHDIVGCRRRYQHRIVAQVLRCHFGEIVHLRFNTASLVKIHNDIAIHGHASFAKGRRQERDMQFRRVRQSGPSQMIQAVILIEPHPCRRFCRIINQSCSQIIW